MRIKVNPKYLHHYILDHVAGEVTEHSKQPHGRLCAAVASNSSATTV